jgi:hypothetical protein
MLAPHDAENAQLRVVRLAAEQIEYPLIFFGGEAVLLDQLRTD